MYNHDLIKSIRQYPCLYDKCSRSTQEYNKCWNNVALETGVELAKCQSRWRNLRDRFVKEYKRFVEYDRPSSWRYFKDLKFLKDFIGWSALTKSYKPSAQQGESEDHSYFNSNINYCEEQDDGNSRSKKRSRDESLDEYDEENPLDDPVDPKRQILDSLIETTVNEPAISQPFQTKTTTASKMKPIEAQKKFDTLIGTLNVYLKSRISEKPKTKHQHFYGLLSTHFDKLPENEQDKLKADILLMVLNKTKDI